MAKRVFNVKLSDASIDKCIDNLRKYQRSLDEKMKLFMDALADIGIEVIHSTVSAIPPEELRDYEVEKMRLRYSKVGHYGEISIHLKSQDVLFIEFSAGVTFGSSDYPLDSGSGYGVGTYPGQTHAFSPDGWYYKDENGETVHSYGNRAYMPMYHSLEAMSIAVWHTAMKTIGA